jgi:hypothetical protein
MLHLMIPEPADGNLSPVTPDHIAYQVDVVSKRWPCSDLKTLAQKAAPVGGIARNIDRWFQGHVKQGFMAARTTPRPAVARDGRSLPVPRNRAAP